MKSSRAIEGKFESPPLDSPLSPTARHPSPPTCIDPASRTTTRGPCAAASHRPPSFGDHCTKWRVCPNSCPTNPASIFSPSSSSASIPLRVGENGPVGQRLQNSDTPSFLPLLLPHPSSTEPVDPHLPAAAAAVPPLPPPWHARAPTAPLPWSGAGARYLCVSVSSPPSIDHKSDDRTTLPSFWNAAITRPSTYTSTHRPPSLLPAPAREEAAIGRRMPCACSGRPICLCLMSWSIVSQARARLCTHRIRRRGACVRLNIFGEAATGQGPARLTSGIDNERLQTQESARRPGGDQIAKYKGISPKMFLGRSMAVSCRNQCCPRQGGRLTTTAVAVLNIMGLQLDRPLPGALSLIPLRGRSHVVYVRRPYPYLQQPWPPTPALVWSCLQAGVDHLPLSRGGERTRAPCCPARACPARLHMTSPLGQPGGSPYWWRQTHGVSRRP